MVWQVECSFRRRGGGGGGGGGGGTAADGYQAAPLSGELGAGYVYNVSLIRGLFRKGTTATPQVQAQGAAALGGACKVPPALSTLCPEVPAGKELGGREVGSSRGLVVNLDQGDKAVTAHCADAAAGTVCHTVISCAPELCLANGKVSVVQYI